jgi:hypothetical protein
LAFDAPPDPAPLFAAEHRGRAILAVAIPHGHPLASPNRPGPPRHANLSDAVGTIPGLHPLLGQAAEPRNRQSLLKAVRCNARAAFNFAAQ